eukprot:TRINITY_DN981_c0_g1_i5.p1 TRINITY_DN981_c0_g1~~TRINITY_DN981_c0_g1_i5.p1  ORF type:complete len:282 (-),score=28.91 TRINITY_DN981_c0_g1_i5:20-865(-)
MEQNMDKVNSMEQNVDKASKPQGLAELSPGSPALPPTPTDEIKGLSIAVKPARVASNKQKKRRNLYSTAPDAPVAKRRERERPSQNGAKKRTRKQDIASDVKALWLVDNLNIDQDPRSQVELSPQALSRALVGRSVYGYQGSFCHRLGKRTLKPHQRKKALLVDDITVTVHLTLHSLHRAGFEDVDTATNGRMAVTMATKREYDIILMDIKLPVISGIEATKEIRAFENKLHRQPSFIVALTGSVSKEDLDAYKEVGDRKSGSAGMPRPISYAVFCLKKKN